MQLFDRAGPRTGSQGIGLAGALLLAGVWMTVLAAPQTRANDTEAGQTPTDQSRADQTPAGQTSAGQGPAGQGPAEQGQVGGMVSFPGGQTLIGHDRALPDERPQFTMDINPFRLDRSPVTVGAFRRFVSETNYETDAETFGNAAVMVVGTGQWLLVDGADWTHPQGPDEPAAKDDHPVTQVSWRDATAYCTWQDKRLPTEFEWEYAARYNQPENPVYAFGESYVREGAYLANIWSGLFPVMNDGNDGFVFTSPVGHFGTTPQGLTDMAGNVWEWTDSWYRPYTQRETPFNPGPASERVQRGGSYLCDPKFCHGFRVSARSHSTPDSSLMHVGFRCAQ